MAPVTSRNYTQAPARDVQDAIVNFLSTTKVANNLKASFFSEPAARAPEPLRDIATRFEQKLLEFETLTRNLQIHLLATALLLTGPGLPAPRVMRTGHPRLGSRAPLYSETSLPWLTTDQVARLYRYFNPSRAALQTFTLCSMELRNIQCEVIALLAKQVHEETPLKIKLDKMGRDFTIAALFRPYIGNNAAIKTLNKKALQFSNAISAPISANLFIDGLRVILWKSSLDIPEVKKLDTLKKTFLDAHRLVDQRDSYAIEALEVYQNSLMTTLAGDFPDFVLQDLACFYNKITLQSPPNLTHLCLLHRLSMFTLAKRAHDKKRLPERFSHHDLRIFIEGFCAHATLPRSNSDDLALNALFTEYEGTTIPSWAIEEKLRGLD